MIFHVKKSSKKSKHTFKVQNVLDKLICEPFVFQFVFQYYWKVPQKYFKNSHIWTTGYILKTFMEVSIFWISQIPNSRFLTIELKWWNYNQRKQNYFLQNYKFSNLQIIRNHKMVCNLQSVSTVHGCIKRIYYEIERKTTEKKPTKEIGRGHSRGSHCNFSCQLNFKTLQKDMFT